MEPRSLARRVMMLLLCLGGIPTVASAGPGPTSSRALEEAVDQLDAIDRTTVSVDYDAEPLDEVVRDLGRISPVPVWADWEALDRLGVGEVDPVTLRLESTSLSTVLAAITFDLADEFERPVFEIHAGRLVLTTLRATESMRLTDIYDVRDLLADGAIDRLRALEPPPESARAREAPVPGEAEPGGDRGAAPDGAASGDEPAPTPGDPAPAPPPERGPLVPGVDIGDLGKMVSALPPPEPLEPAAELMSLLAEHVDPDAWLRVGGSRAVIGARGGAVIVSAPPTTHRKFREALRQLRRTMVSAIDIEAAIVEVPRSAFDRQARRHDLDSALLGRALLAADGAAVHWRAVSAVAIGETLAVQSEHEGIEIRLELRPHFDRATGILSIDVEARTMEGADHRHVSTTVVVPLRHGGAVLELPAAKPSEWMRVLVLLGD